MICTHKTKIVSLLTTCLESMTCSPTMFANLSAHLICNAQNKRCICLPRFSHCLPILSHKVVDPFLSSHPTKRFFMFGTWHETRNETSDSTNTTQF
ncbi:hypothetical protein COCSADRAFT_262547 [Bipolaris sorokiniana ND90Pr]|uniref:Uncharacterized protein n=1 Tax=Cochliobolus sativus (strain ND90Pr / ATCC 201652) TaxID=665912 RepID=M2S8V7_COCSN|nr:uncharacterized protein COCSADRAFT_262547 [Bipolaris sorokiniana ND90Pr]EMD58995.1 hypothetical protein COCSADRAFT_262547 [Bipolaris sorokiniana ND90Pr]